MIKHDLKNWIYTNDLEGLLFFAQRLNEALFDFCLLYTSPSPRD